MFILTHNLVFPVLFLLTYSRVSDSLNFLRSSQPHSSQASNLPLNAPRTGYHVLFGSCDYSNHTLTTYLCIDGQLHSYRSSWKLAKFNSHRSKLLLLFLTLSGDIESNPGPSPKYPCKQCNKSVKNNQKGICCDDCDSWVHSKCAGISNAAYNTLASSSDDWFCSECLAPCGLCGLQCRRSEKAVQCDNCDLWIHTKCCNIDDPKYSELMHSSCTWVCDTCDFMNFSDSFFSTNNSINCTNSFEPLQNCSSGLDSGSNHHPDVKLKTNPKREKRKVLKLLVINFQSVRNKTASVESLIKEKDPDVIIGTETWLNSEITSAEIFPDNYTVVRKDRNSNGYGGVLQAIKNDLIFTELTKLDSDCEIIWTKFQFPKEKSMYIGTFYRPSHIDLTSLLELKKSLQKLGKNADNNNVILAGDFNQPNIDWSQNIISGTNASSEAAKILLEVTNSFNLTQMVQSPTRDNNILDLVFTNNSPAVTSANVIPGISDHDIVELTLNISPPRKKLPKRKIYLKKKANIERIKEDLTKFKLQYYTKFNNSIDVDEKWNSFEQEIKLIIDKNTPHKFTSTKQNLPWFTRIQRRLCKKKHKLFKKAKTTQQTNDWTTYKSFRKTVRINLKKARNTFICNKLKNSLTENPKAFWSYIKRLRSNSVGVSDLLDNGKLCSDSKTKANILNDQFFSVFTEENTSQIPVTKPITNSKINQLIITPEGVKKQLHDLDPNKASGPDQIPPWFLKTHADDLYEILTDLFQTSVDNGTIPNKWKEANICSVFKKGDKHNPANYRPVSLTCVCSKILEHIIHSHVMKFLDEHNILTDLQHGFRAKRSTETQLLLTINDISKQIDQNSNVSMAILDFSKAFDKVPHQRLLSKLSAYGIDGNLLAWFASFLNNRTQRVVCDGEISDSKQVLSGVPQGTVLGPLLFLLYVNDIPDNINSTVRLFADDCLVYRTIDNPSDQQILQDDLNKLEQWQNKWQMNFNPSKCYILSISSKKCFKSPVYTLCNQPLKHVNSHPYLGVEIDNKLRWDKHIHNITKKANSILGLLKRNLSNCPTDVKSTAYKALVRPVLEYASSVWDPHHQCDVDKLESIQRRAARFCMADYSYKSSVKIMLHELDWPLLKTRRHNTRLHMLYKINNNLVAINKDELIPTIRTNTRNNHDLNFQVPYAKKNVYKHSFFPHTLKDWNALPSDIVHAPSLNCFKAKLTNTCIAN